MIDRLPDTLLTLGMRLPWPADRLSFAVLKRALLALDRVMPSVLSIRIGSLRIAAPSGHPAVFWRHRPASANRNYIVLVQAALAHRRGAVIDVGANIGDGVALLRSQGVAAPIYAIEGTEEWFGFLARNTAGLPDVTLVKAYLGARAQQGGLSIDQSLGTGTLIEGDSDLEIQTLDSVLNARGSPAVAVLKTDTDGFDAQVLYGSRDLLSAQTPVVFAEFMEGLLNRNGDSSANLLNDLAAHGYAHMLIWDNNGLWLEARPIAAGIDDLLASRPGGPGEPYLDIAFLAPDDRPIADAVEAAYRHRPPAYHLA